MELENSTPVRNNKTYLDGSIEKQKERPQVNGKCLLHIALEILARAIRQFKKKKKSIKMKKEEVILFLFTINMMMYIENPKESTI